ncbi:MAG: hypothetical protein OZ924_17805 [Burkholderiaceae bacterium]|nr:hypothetical protein [Burkholderiaceae bacterium]
MLAEMPKAKGTLKRGPVVPDENRGEVTLADLGIDKKVSPTGPHLPGSARARVNRN